MQNCRFSASIAGNNKSCNYSIKDVALMQIYSKKQVVLVNKPAYYKNNTEYILTSDNNYKKSSVEHLLFSIRVTKIISL